MTATIEMVDELMKKVRLLPTPVVRQLAEYIDFLEYKYAGAEQVEDEEAQLMEGEEEFSESELAEIDRRVAEYEADPGAAISMQTVYEIVDKRYGL